MPRRPKAENLRLRSLLDDAGMSNKGLARRVADAAAASGVANVRCDHTSVLRWLAGEQPRPPVPELVAIVLGEALGRKLSATELGMTPSDLPANLGLKVAADWIDTVSISTALWGADVQHRRFLINTAFSPAALSAAALRWLTYPVAGEPSAAGIRRIGRADIEAIRGLTAAYREMDNKLGGGQGAASSSPTLTIMFRPYSRAASTGRRQGGNSPAHAASCHNWLAGSHTTVMIKVLPSDT